MSTKKVNFRLPDDLVDEADAVAAIERKNRTELVTEALRNYLREVENDDEFKERVVERYLDDELGFETLKTVVGRRDAEAVRSSKTLLERGDELADDLAALVDDE